MSGHKINRKVYWARKLSPEMQALATEKCKGTDYGHLNHGTHICREHRWGLIRVLWTMASA